MSDPIEHSDCELVYERVDQADGTDGDNLAIVRGELGTRRVDWKVRNRGGRFEYACEYYDNGSLLYVSDWEPFEFVGINETGTTVQFAYIHGGGTMDFDMWIETASEVYLRDELTEIWSDVKMLHGHA